MQSPKRDVSISSLHSQLRELHSNGDRKIVTAEGDGAHQGNKTSENDLFMFNFMCISAASMYVKCLVPAKAPGEYQISLEL